MTYPKTSAERHQELLTIRKRLAEPEPASAGGFRQQGARIMSMRELEEPRSSHPQTLTAAIFDVDGVLLASPHEHAWREALIGFADPLASPPRCIRPMSRANRGSAAPVRRWRHWACRTPTRKAVVYAERKQKRLEELIHAGSVAAFPDALRFVQAVGALRWPMAVASSSKNANAMMRQIRLDFRPKPARHLHGQCLRSRFAARQAEPGDFPARRCGTADCTRTLLRGRGRPRRHRGGQRGRHDGARRCPAAGTRPACRRQERSRGDEPGRSRNR